MFGGAAFGGGDAGNQFAGGGFMPSQANDAGYGGGGGSGGGKRGTGAHTLRTVTVRQLKDLAHQDDDRFLVDGVELDNLTVLGKLVDVQGRTSSLIMTLTDGTGEMELSHWLQEDSELAAQAKRAELRPGVYVKAHGHLARRDNKVTLSAFSVRPITNFNELTYHNLRAIFEHLHLTKGGAGGQQQAGGGGGGGFGAPPAAAGGGWHQGGGGGAPMMGGGPGGGGGGGYGGVGGVDPCQSAVLQIIQASNMEQGVDQTEVYNRLAGQFNRALIDNALQALMAEAHIYQTVDDTHWKAA